VSWARWDCPYLMRSVYCWFVWHETKTCHLMSGVRQLKGVNDHGREAREKLAQHGLSADQAAGVVDVLELWEKDRVVTRKYLDLRLSQLETRLWPMEARIYGRIGVMLAIAVFVQHYWK
jgi:hypothetical protein